MQAKSCQLACCMFQSSHMSIYIQSQASVWNSAYSVPAMHHLLAAHSCAAGVCIIQPCSVGPAIVYIIQPCSLEQCSTCTASMQRAVAGATKDSLTKPDWAHVFLTVIQPLALHQPQQEGQTASTLRAACAGLMSKHSSRLRRAGVVQWEVRLRMPHGLPAWRVVVSSPTGAFKLVKPLWKPAYNTMTQSMRAAKLCQRLCSYNPAAL